MGGKGGGAAKPKYLAGEAQRAISLIARKCEASSTDSFMKQS